jgi:hypothetical protein
MIDLQDEARLRFERGARQVPAINGMTERPVADAGLDRAARKPERTAASGRTRQAVEQAA